MGAGGCWSRFWLGGVVLLGGAWLGCSNGPEIGPSSDLLTSIGCIGEVRAAPAPVRLLADVPITTTLEFSSCGHLLVDGRRLFDPRLEEQASEADSIETSRFAPTGEWLSLRTGDRWILHALGTGERHVVPLPSERANLGFAVRGEGKGSLPWVCADGRILVWDDGAARTLAADSIDCNSIQAASHAPRIAFRGAEEEILVADLDSIGSMQVRGMGRTARSLAYVWEGRSLVRGDRFLLSADGRYLFVQEVVAAAATDIYDEAIGPAEAVILDARDGRVLGPVPARPALPEPHAFVEQVPGRGHGFLWEGPDRSYLLLSGGDVAELAATILLHVGRDYVFAVSGGEVVWIDLDARQNTLPLEGVITDKMWRLSVQFSEAGTALTTTNSIGAPPGHPPLRVWSAAHGPYTVEQPGFFPPIWVGDDGRALAHSIDYDAILFDPRGLALASIPWPGVHHGKVEETATGLLIRMSDGELGHLDTTTGAYESLATGVWSSVVAPDGQRAAWIATTPGAPDRGELWAGALPGATR